MNNPATPLQVPGQQERPHGTLMHVVRAQLCADEMRPVPEQLQTKTGQLLMVKVNDHLCLCGCPGQQERPRKTLHSPMHVVRVQLVHRGQSQGVVDCGDAGVDVDRRLAALPVRVVPVVWAGVVRPVLQFMAGGEGTWQKIRKVKMRHENARSEIRHGLEECGLAVHVPRGNR